MTPDCVDAILMCGEGAASRPVLGNSKIFLPVNGKPIFIYVLDALLRASRVRRVFIVGNKQRIESLIEASGQSLSKPVNVLTQGDNLLDNVWRGFISTLDGYVEGAQNNNPDFNDRVILALAGDSPLITSGEIDDFIAGADMGKYDYVIGLTPASSLARFRPSDGKPGIRMSSFHLREGLFRISNLHLARPFAFRNREVVLKMYEMRYQRSFSNVLRFARSLLATPGWRGRIWLYLGLQTCLTLSRMGLAGVADILRRLIPASSAISAVSQITGARADIVITTHGGAALDIDNESDYRAMTQMFDQWRDGR
ncbi:MAG: NTP transferase domain-containing protein [Nitrospinae bacterium]|nr:NTP transferase domain-containing protein [Nitrospinota bacterium]MBF0634890.1 NTP transferase domain-containing protein [Nitrospinota bacterium]